ncbi:MAG: Flp pilus assembly complex ATPase component [Deltaproteobacteria bacterium]|nr:Flp pilus assembly complex ATPase component [Deltaproteobacteria bacterium]
MAQKKFLGEMLVDAGLITAEQLEEALVTQRQTGVRTGEALIGMGLVSAVSICETIAQQTGVPYIDLDSYHIDKTLLKRIPENLLRDYKIMPLFEIGGTLTIATADPMNVVALDEARRLAGQEIETVVATEQQIVAAIDHYYGVAGTFDEIVREIEGYDVGNAGESAEGAEAAPIIRFIDRIIYQAVHDNASDIHIEPDAQCVRIRSRLDGILHEITSVPPKLQPAFISRLKVMAELDIAETRIPQDGRFQMNVDERSIEFRISTFPTIYGENLVIRILDQSKSVLSLADLGFGPELLVAYKKIVASPYGIVLVTGPTGSGKSTTLYATLNEINSIEKNIITIEDPVEYRLELIRQTQINPKAGLTFASGMRSILRQDPDVIMVGEMRDLETAEIAFQAALTGHLVFSTLHTNDAAGALARLLHLGIEPFLVASSSIGVVAQRLVRKICSNCKTDEAPADELLEKYAVSGLDISRVYRGRGCKMCRNSGYSGRSAIYEVMTVDDELRNIIIQNGGEVQLRETARKSQSMMTLREQGVMKAIAGVTTFEEVDRLTAA